MSLLDTASLIVTPNGYKEGKLYSVIPSDGSGDMSVVRATTATRVNSAGLVELVPYNLLGYSEDFTNASWLKGASTITGNTTTAPNGTLTADTFSGNGASDLHIVLWQTDVIGVGNTISVYAKKNTNDFLQIYTDFVNTDFANFNLANGTTGSVGSSVISSAIESVGNGWYRCSFVVGSASSKYVNFCLVTSSTAGRAETNSLSTSVFLWGAQLNEGTLLPYQKTETRLNIPRLDYSNGTCPSLLVEPQRTNLVTYSSSFDNAGWTTNNATITANAIISPSGIQDAELLTSTSTTETGVFRLISVTGTNTWSVYAKKGSGKYLLINTNAPLISAKFDLESGQVVGTPSGGATATIQDSGNGWYRCVVTSTTAQNRFTIFITNNTIADDFTSSVGLSCYIWGAQLEAGSYSTSFIPTTSASVTRNADVISKTGISSLIGQTEGTIFLDVYAQLNSADEQDISISDGTGNNRAIIRLTSSGTIRGIGVFGGNLEFNIGGSAYTTGTRYKIALAYKNNDVALYVNGTSQGTSSSTTISGTLSRLGFDVFTNGAQIICSPTNAVALWKTRLTNTQLAQLTTI
jgi:hypothetical protein